MKALKEKRISLRSLWRRSLVILSLFALVFAVACNNQSAGGGGDDGYVDPNAGSIPLEVILVSAPSVFTNTTPNNLYRLREGMPVDLTGARALVRFTNGDVTEYNNASDFSIYPPYYISTPEGTGPSGGAWVRPTYTLFLHGQGRYAAGMVATWPGTPLQFPAGTVRPIEQLHYTGSLDKRAYFSDDLPDFSSITFEIKYAGTNEHVSFRLPRYYDYWEYAMPTHSSPTTRFMRIGMPARTLAASSSGADAGAVGYGEGANPTGLWGILAFGHSSAPTYIGNLRNHPGGANNPDGIRAYNYVDIPLDAIYYVDTVAFETPPAFATTRIAGINTSNATYALNAGANNPYAMHSALPSDDIQRGWLNEIEDAVLRIGYRGTTETKLISVRDARAMRSLPRADHVLGQQPLLVLPFTELQGNRSTAATFNGITNTAANLVNGLTHRNPSIRVMYRGIWSDWLPVPVFGRLASITVESISGGDIVQMRRRGINPDVGLDDHDVFASKIRVVGTYERIDDRSITTTRELVQDRNDNGGAVWSGGVLVTTPTVPEYTNGSTFYSSHINVVRPYSTTRTATVTVYSQQAVYGGIPAVTRNARIPVTFQF